MFVVMNSNEPVELLMEVGQAEAEFVATSQNIASTRVHNMAPKSMSSMTISVSVPSGMTDRSPFHQCRLRS